MFLQLSFAQQQWASIISGLTSLCPIFENTLKFTQNVFHQLLEQKRKVLYQLQKLQ